MGYTYVQDVAAAWEEYERVVAALGDEWPDGLIVHVAGGTALGYRIIEVWESREAWERFRSGRLRPAVRALAGDGPTQEPTFESFEVQDVRAR